MDFLNQLNDSQRDAVTHIDGASLVIAGAGSGKTRVLTYKIAYLITQGYKPWEIMALTFTNKAAREMKERITQLVGEEAKYIVMGTFHSIFSRILRKEAARLGFDSNFTIYDESDSRSLCKIIIKQLELDDKAYKPSEVHNRISWAKNKLLTPDDYKQTTAAMLRDSESNMPLLQKIYSLYFESCKSSNAMDFDDLLLYTFKLFNEHEDIRKRYAEKFRFVLVDEYQDTNYAQQQIIWQLTSEHKHVCVVGDDAQSIYGFRGADINNILDFQKQYEGSKLFKLEQNYRSTQRIVLAANSLIKHNNRQIPKDTFSRNDEGDKLQLLTLSSDREEAVCVCKDIKSGVRRQNAQYSDYAILYRTNSQSRTFEEQLLKDGIPYRVYGGMSFFQRKEIKDIIAYFRLVVNHNDDEAFRRIINYPARGIGNTTLNKIIAEAQQSQVSLWTVVKNLHANNVGLNKGTIEKLRKFTDEMEYFASRLGEDDAFDLGSEIIKKTGISAEIYKGKDPEDLSRQEHLEEFVSSLQEFVEGNREEDLPVSLVDFLHDVSLLTDKESTNEDTNVVTLMTIHSAKGLEFPTVYIVGLEENIFPSPMSTDSPHKLEEERRLFYVAITRAEKRCVLTCAKSRYRYGKMEFDAPSRFLRDIDPRLLSTGTTSMESSSPVSRNSSYGAAARQHQSFSMFGTSSSPSQSSERYNPGSQRRNLVRVSGNESANNGNTPSRRPFTNALDTSSQSHGSQGFMGFSVGDMITHPRFGQGQILELSGGGDSAKATVKFQNVGTKQLLLKYAKIKKL